MQHPRAATERVRVLDQIHEENTRPADRVGNRQSPRQQGGNRGGERAAGAVIGSAGDSG